MRDLDAAQRAKVAEAKRILKAATKKAQKLRPKKVAPIGRGQREPRKRDNGYLAFLRRLPCLECGSRPSDAAHVRMSFLQPGWRYVGKAEKPDDNRAVPLCRRSHELQHSMAETRFWAEKLPGLHAPTVCAELYACYQKGGDGEALIRTLASRSERSEMAHLGDVMVDLETLGTTPGCVVLSVGLVLFDRASHVLGSELRVNIDRASSERAGLTVDPATEVWWSEQTGEARAALLSPAPVLLEEAGRAILQFWERHKPERVWAHGASFDVPILAQALAAVGMANPWHYRAPRDTRTLFDLTGTQVRHTTGVHHSAVDDARAQAVAVQEAWRALALDRVAA